MAVSKTLPTDSQSQSDVLDAVNPRTIKRVLVCRPSHFTVDYVINPHMQPYAVNASKAKKEWDQLVKTLRSLNIKVDIIEQEPDVPDMVFAADQGIVHNGSVLLANFRYSQRQKERVYYRKWFREHGFRLRSLSNIFPFEGADSLFFGDTLLVGIGFRASVSSCEELAIKLAIEVMPLRLLDPYFYELDMAFLPINAATAFYYPPAFSPFSQNLLKRLVPNLYTLSEQEAKAYSANSFVSGHDIVIATGTPDRFRKRLQKLGLRIHEVDISEFKKAGGGIRCLINVLE
ncbi:MAG TPA: arginine deiminase family protein [Candidatus Dormibacteraeota bacterium]|nr:arginine deiminase family protein [Candidatus Dormibacteraeota bacterium]